MRLIWSYLIKNTVFESAFDTAGLKISLGLVILLNLFLPWLAVKAKVLPSLLELVDFPVVGLRKHRAVNAVCEHFSLVALQDVEFVDIEATFILVDPFRTDDKRYSTNIDDC